MFNVTLAATVLAATGAGAGGAASRRRAARRVAGPAVGRRPTRATVQPYTSLGREPGPASSGRGRGRVLSSRFHADPAGFVLVGYATSQPADVWEVLTALGTVAAAAFGAVSATAAWLAARASARTSREATEALANTIVPRPRVQGVYKRQSNGTSVGHVVIANDLSYPAADVDVRVTRRDGRHFEKQVRSMAGRYSDDTLEIDIGPIAPDTLEGYEALVVREVRIRFSDERKLAGYERTEDYSAVTEPPAVPAVSEERISPTRGPLIRPVAMLG